MNRAVRDDAYLYCPQCGAALIWDNTEDRGEIDMETLEAEDDYTTIDFFHCDNCGVSIEIWQALEGDKEIYPYWNESIKKYEEDEVHTT